MQISHLANFILYLHSEINVLHVNMWKCTPKHWWYIWGVLGRCFAGKKKRTTSGWWWNLRDLYLAYLKVQKGCLSTCISFTFHLRSLSTEKTAGAPGFPSPTKTPPCVVREWRQESGIRSLGQIHPWPAGMKTWRLGKVHPWWQSFLGGSKKGGSPNLDAQNIETARFTALKMDANPFHPELECFCK